MHVFNLFRKVQTAFKVKDQGNKEFWLSQTFVLAATVLGVYLASMEGFKLALKFERLTNERESYYLQTALYNELQDNIELTESLIAEYDDEKKRYAVKHKQQDFQNSKFIWETMQGSNAIFQVSPQILNNINLYYRDAARHKEQIHKMLGYDSTYARNTLKAQTDKLKSETVPRLQKNIRSLETKLQKTQLLDQ